MFDGAVIEVPCPGCKTPNPMSFGDIREKPSFECVSCGRSVRIDASELNAGMSSIERSMDDLRKSLKRLKL